MNRRDFLKAIGAGMVGVAATVAAASLPRMAERNWFTDDRDAEAIGVSVVNWYYDGTQEMHISGDTITFYRPGIDPTAA